MTKMEILRKITPAVLIVRKLTPKTGGKRQNRGSLYGLGRKNLKKTTNFWARKGPKSDEQIYKILNLIK